MLKNLMLKRRVFSWQFQDFFVSSGIFSSVRLFHTFQLISTHFYIFHTFLYISQNVHCCTYLYIEVHLRKCMYIFTFLFSSVKVLCILDEQLCMILYTFVHFSTLN